MYAGTLAYADKQTNSHTHNHTHVYIRTRLRTHTHSAHSHAGTLAYASKQTKTHTITLTIHLRSHANSFTHIRTLERALRLSDLFLHTQPFNVSLLEKGELTEAARKVFLEVHKRFDRDRDGALSPVELDALQLVCQGEPLGKEVTLTSTLAYTRSLTHSFTR